MRQPSERVQRRGVESGRARVGDREHRHLVDLAGGQRRRVQRLLEAAGEGDDQAQRGDADRDPGGRQGRPQRTPARAAEPDFQGVAPVHAGRRIDRFLAPHGRLARVELDRLAVDHAHHAPGAPGNLGVVRDEHHGRSAAVEVVKQVEHTLAGGGVEAARRLVGQDQPGPVGQGTGHRDLLLLAAGQAPSACPSAVLEPDQGKQVACPLPPVLQLDAGQRQRQGDVVLHRHRRDEVEGLEDRAHPLQAIVGEVAVGQLAERQPGGVHVTRRGAVEAPHQREHRALAATGRPDDRDVLARADVERDVAQRRDTHLVAAAELSRDCVEAETDRLAEQVSELIELRRRRRAFDGWIRILEDGYRCGDGLRDGLRGLWRAVLSVLSVLPVPWVRGCLGLPAGTAAAAALGAA